MVFERRIFAKISDGRQTSSDFKPNRTGLALGWVTTFLFIYLFIYNAHSKRNYIKIHIIHDGVAYNRARLQTKHAPKIIIIAMLIIIIVILIIINY